MGFRRCHQYFFQLSLKKWSSFVFFGEGGVLSGSFYWRTVKLTHLSFSWIEKNIWLNVLTDSWLLYEDDTCLIEKLCQWALPTILNWHLCSMAYQTNPTKTKIKIFLNLFLRLQCICIFYVFLQMTWIEPPNWENYWQPITRRIDIAIVWRCMTNLFN